MKIILIMFTILTMATQAWANCENGSWKVGDTCTFYIQNNGVSGSVDCSSAITYRVYEDETATPVASGTMELLDSSNTDGFYSEALLLDGAWADPGVPDAPNITVVYHNESIGQRGAQNEGARISQAKYVMKMDAHCVVDEGFDVKMLEAIKGHDNWTMVPMMYNLHAFDWVCPDGHKKDQGPTPTKGCLQCGKPVKRDILMVPRWSRRSTFYRFDKTLHFQYWGDFNNREEGKPDIAPTMSLQGSCFMLTRERYWALEIADEKHGSWGQQGVEVALKTWLSGGQVMVNKKRFRIPFPSLGI